MYRQRSTQRRSKARHAGLAKSLGWFSVALGVLELAAPRLVAQAAGLKTSHVGSIRLCGVREIVTGIGILASRNAAPWLWARVGGDIVDLAGIVAASDKSGSASIVKAGAAAMTIAAVTGVDAYTAQTYKQAPRRTYDYSGRSGFPRDPELMRGAALKDFNTPEDYRAPAAMRPDSRRDRSGAVASESY